MKDNIAVLFTEHGARIYHGIELADWKDSSTCLINPELPQGVAPHHWKVENGQIVVMSYEERAERDQAIGTAQNKVTAFTQEYMARPAPAPVPTPINSYSAHYPFVALLLGALGGALASTALKLLF